MANRRVSRRRLVHRRFAAAPVTAFRMRLEGTPRGSFLFHPKFQACLSARLLCRVAFHRTHDDGASGPPGVRAVEDVGGAVIWRGQTDGERR